tara:strand:- start:185 stop:1219 length:1035 start_codon:yes stop_codon:yes gene_type:complete
MNVAQRATSVADLGAAAGYFTVDRWQLGEGDASAGRLTMSQTADGPNGISANCIKLDCTTADTSIAAGEYLLLGTILEGQNIQRIGKGVAGAKQVTASFYVKASAAFNFVLELYDSDNNRQISKLFSTTTGWVRHEFTIPADVDDGSSPFADDNGASLYMNFWLHGGSNFTSGTLNTASWANSVNANRLVGIDSFFSSTDNNFFVTGVQLEVGPVATELEQEEISTTLQKCQRYFQTTYPIGYAVGSTGNISWSIETINGPTANNYLSVGWDMPVKMRTVPTASLYNPTTGSSSASNNIWHTAGTSIPSAVGNISPNAMLFYVNNTAVGANGAIMAHFVADAEL